MFYETLSNEVVAQRLALDQYSTFSYEGALALAEYLTADDEQIEFDPVALRCEFAEYSSAFEAATEHGLELPYGADENEEFALEWLEEHTVVIPLSEGVVIQQF